DIDNKGGKWTKYLLHPLIHSLKIFCYILAVNVVFGIVLHFVGIDKLSAFMLSTKEFQPFLVGLVGLIPNCASSVLIAQLFVNGMINFGSAVAGLSVNAGIAFTVLFTNKHTKSNILIIVTLYVVSTLLGFALSFIPFFN
ncbi:MAG: putative manganese transporter, partial [Clostridia bacterium]